METRWQAFNISGKLQVMKPSQAVLLLSDLPVWGRVALASAAPLLESQGIQACCLPTALLSTHGAYPGAVCQEQTEFLKNAIEHLRSLNLNFSGVDVGFTAGLDQFPLIAQVILEYKAKGAFVLVDPILGDNGHLYGLFRPSFIQPMRDLVRMAHVITPNLTEAALLLGKAPDQVPQNQDELKEWLRALADLGPSWVVITSAPVFRLAGGLGLASYDKKKQAFHTWEHKRTQGGFPGTGDVFATMLLAHLLKGRNFTQAVSKALKKTLYTVNRSDIPNRDRRQGLIL